MSARADQAAGSAPAGAAPARLLTARELVAELARLGAGHWTPDAVRQWTREQPPCPIAAVGVQGQPHRYSLLAVLDWLLARAKREKPKGYSRADGVAAIAPLDEARRKALADHAPIFAATGASAPEGEGAAKDPDITALAREIGARPSHVVRALENLELVVSRFRDPRSRKAHEEARLARLKADEREGSLVPASEVDRLLEDLVVSVRAQLQALPGQLAPALEACSTAFERRAAIERHVDGVLMRLATGPSGGADGATDASR